MIDCDNKTKILDLIIFDAVCKTFLLDANLKSGRTDLIIQYK